MRYPRSPGQAGRLAHPPVDDRPGCIRALLGDNLLARKKGDLRLREILQAGEGDATLSGLEASPSGTCGDKRDHHQFPEDAHGVAYRSI